ncbi:MAG TPA: DUF3025 domain-containing protein [Burkholderiales bacterium]|nr:DUF3025 domain-containing protein [Burkholderiales bacterium]
MFEPLRPAGLAFSKLTDWPTFDDYQRLLAGKGITNAAGLPLRFVSQGPKSGKPEDKYEARIYLRGEVQVRSQNWHDLFNALVWLIFPRSKAALNRRHFLSASESEEKGEKNRGPVRDALTLFDEGGVIVACSDSRLAQLLVDFKWKELFWVNRDAVIASMKFFLFGHAIYEKALQPFTGVTGRAVIFPVAADFFAAALEQQLQSLDEKLAGYLNNPQHFNHTADLAPVPILGIPGWNTENERESYYENEAYFRAGRKT